MSSNSTDEINLLPYPVVSDTEDIEVFNSKLKNEEYKISIVRDLLSYFLEVNNVCYFSARFLLLKEEKTCMTL